MKIFADAALCTHDQDFKKLGFVKSTTPQALV